VNISLNMRAVAGGAPLPEELLTTERFHAVFDVVDAGLMFALRVSAYSRARLMQRRRRRLEEQIRA
jgi:hypothetical protein